MRISQVHILVLYCMLLFLGVYSIPKVTGRPVMDISDNIFHLVNQKGIQTGYNPFWKITHYPMLFYYIPIDIITMELIICYIIIPLLIYIFSKQFTTEKETHIRLFAPLIWLMSGIPFLAVGFYGQMVAMVLVVLTLYFWIIKKYVFGALCAVLVPFGHTGSTYLILAIVPFLIFQTYLNYNKINWSKSIFRKNSISFTAISISLIPALLISVRGWIPISFFGSIFIGRILINKPDIIVPILMITGIFMNITVIANYYLTHDWYYLNFDELLETHYDNGAYCFYTNVFGDTEHGPSHITMRGWYYYDIPVKECPKENYTLNGMEEFEIFKDYSLNNAQRYVNLVVYGDKA